MIQLLLKMCLQSHQTQHAMAATIWTTLLLPTKWQSTRAALAAAKQYDQTVKAAGKGHNMGPPHLHVALAFLEQILAEFPQLCPQDGWAAGIKELCEGPQVQVNRTIVYFKVRATYASREAAAGDKEAKLTFAFVGGKKDTFGGKVCSRCY